MATNSRSNKHHAVLFFLTLQTILETGDSQQRIEGYAGPIEHRFFTSFYLAVEPDLTLHQVVSDPGDQDKTDQQPDFHSSTPSGGLAGTR